MRLSISVEFYSDGEFLASTSVRPYKSWPLLEPETHTLTAKSKDPLGRVNTSDPVSVTVLPWGRYGTFSLRRLKDGAALLDWVVPDDARHRCLSYTDDLGNTRFFQGPAVVWPGGTYLDLQARDASQRFYAIVLCL